METNLKLNRLLQDNSYQEFKLKNNSKSMWDSVSMEVMKTIGGSGADSAAGQIPDCFLFSASISDSGDYADHDVLLLQYFFPIVDRIHAYTQMKNTKSVKLILFVKISNNNDFYRTAHFLFSMGLLREDLLIFIGEDRREARRISKKDLTNFGKIIPLFKVGKKPEAYANLIEELGGPHEIQAGEIDAVFDNNMECLAAGNHKGKTAFFNQENITQTSIIKSLCLNNIWEMLENVHGESRQGKSMLKEIKQEVFDELKPMIIEYCKQLNLISMLLWSVSIRYLFDQKELVYLENGKIVINRSIIQHSFSDAVAYGEGLMQILENSCVHTQRQSAYFGLRVHYTDRAAPYGEHAEAARTLVGLNKKYYELQNKAMRNYGIGDIEREVSYYLEIFSIDDAFVISGQGRGKTAGITDKYREDHADYHRGDINLKKIFEDDPRADSIDGEAWMEQCIVHYGLRILRKNVLINDGYFIVNSPAVEGTERVLEKYQSSLDAGSGYAASPGEMTLVTEYNILLPIRHTMPEGAPGIEGYGDIALFDESYISAQGQKPCFENKYLRMDDVWEEAKKDGEKQEIIINLKKVLEERLEEATEEVKAVEEPEGAKKGWHEKNMLPVIDVTCFEEGKIEFFAKALFRYFSEKKSELLSGQKKMNMALYFSKENAIFEFIRFYSIFSDRMGNNECMRNVQIALCGKNENNELPEVKFLLAGWNVDSAHITARIFSYYNAEASLKYIPQLRYITRILPPRQGGEEIVKVDNADYKEKAVPQFPFELFLNLRIGEDGAKVSEVGECWFFRKIEDVLRRDIRDNKYGCMIDNIHVRVGSKIHVDRYYEAEMLFHNVWNIKHFAFLLAQDMCDPKIDMAGVSDILIVGYENYSTILTQEVVRLLQNYFKKKVTHDKQEVRVHYGTIISEKEGRDNLVLEKDSGQTIRRNRVAGKLGVFTILPVGTTLSIVYKMKSIIERLDKQNDKKLDLLDIIGLSNYSLVITGDLEAWKPEDTVAGLYWKEVKRTEKEIELRPKEAGEEARTEKVKYFLEAKNTWYDASHCELCGKGKVLLNVDKSLVSPNVIFELSKSHKECFVDLIAQKNINGYVFSERIADLTGDASLEEQLEAEGLAGCWGKNEKRIKEMEGCFIYSHLADDHNHFQYYFDLLEYFNRANKGKDFEKWAKHCSKQIEKEAFNIVVSPLNEKNDAFLKSVIDHVFESSIRFLHIPIMDTFKESVRSKFSYISEEYRQIKKLNPKAKVNVYYVDDTIISGQTLTRARTMIQLLLHESQMKYDTKSLFSGVFSLINRCSADTIRTFIHDSRNYFAYVHLAIPSYNTFSDRCPACALEEQYELLGKRSSTSQFSAEYTRLSKKHIKKTKEEFLNWEREIIYTSHGYFAWLKQYLYQQQKRGFGEIRKRIAAPFTADKKELKDAAKTNAFKAREAYKKKLCSINLNNIGINSDLMGKAVEEMKKEVINKRNFKRMQCTHEIYCTLEPLTKIESYKSEHDYPAGKLVERTKQAILDIICRKVEETEDAEEKVEWITSYIKVTSRNQLAKYHHVREAVFYILQEMAERLLSENITYSRDTRISKIMEAVSAPSHNVCREYQFLFVVLRRLAALQSNKFLDKNFHIQIIKKWVLLNNIHFDSLTGEAGSEEERYFLYNEFPTKDKLIFDLIKLIKWVAVSDNDRAKTYLIERELEGNADSEDASVNEIYQDFQRVLLLENTRIIYDGIAQLSTFLKQAGICEDGYKDFITDALRAVKSEEGLLYQNPLILFYKFYDVSGKGSPSNDSNVERFISMIRYYDLLEEMNDGDAPVPESLYPDCYAKVCDCIRDILGYSECQLVLYENDEISMVANSSIEKDRLEAAFRRNNLNAIVKKINGPQTHDKTTYSQNVDEMEDSPFGDEMGDIVQLNDRYRMAETVCLIDTEVKSETGKKEKVLVLEIDGVADVADEPNSAKVYMILQNKKEKNECQDASGKEGRNPNAFDEAGVREELMDVRNVLFLRENLRNMLRNSMHIVLNERHNFGSVHPVGGGRKQAEKVLHVSDLHIKEGDKESVLNAISKKNFGSNPFDLLIVTGDVANSEKTAGGMEKNYKDAADVIREIAKKIFCKNDNYLVHDWKKRVVIIPGNHDYATMNELQSELKNRRVRAGRPSETEGGIMAKFAYYINFMRDLLDKELNDWISNDLNEYRCYSNLGVDILALNSSANANYMRTNKVKLNKRAIQKVMYHRDCKNSLICIVHHSPNFKINYLIDIYGDSKRFRHVSKEATEYANLFEQFIKQSDEYIKQYAANEITDNGENGKKRELLDTIRASILEVREDLHNKMRIDARRKIEANEKERKDIDIEKDLVEAGLANEDLLLEKTQLNRDIQYYVVDQKYLDFTDERCMALRRTLISTTEISGYDKAAFDNTFEEIGKLLEANDHPIILAGHEHREKKSLYNELIPIYISAKILNKNNIVNCIILKRLKGGDWEYHSSGY